MSDSKFEENGCTLFDDSSEFPLVVSEKAQGAMYSWSKRKHRLPLDVSFQILVVDNKHSIFFGFSNDCGTWEKGGDALSVTIDGNKAQLRANVFERIIKPLKQRDIKSCVIKRWHDIRFKLSRSEASVLINGAEITKCKLHEEDLPFEMGRLGFFGYTSEDFFLVQKLKFHGDFQSLEDVELSSLSEYVAQRVKKIKALMLQYSEVGVEIALLVAFMEATMLLD